VLCVEAVLVVVEVDEGGEAEVVVVLVLVTELVSFANVVFNNENSSSRLSTAAFLWDATPRKVTVSSSSSSKTQRRPRPWNNRT